MRGRFLVLIIVALLMSHVGASRAEAFVFINEFLADPATGLAGDANNDGVRHSYDDEFVELFNFSSVSVNIGGWYITDSEASIKRHTFDAGSKIGSNSTFVVFGDWMDELDDSMPENWQRALSGSLSFNNSGDTITLYDASGIVMDSYAYGSEAGDNQSMVRDPEGSKGNFVKHTILPNANGKLFSPGYLVNEIDLPSQSTVPEPTTVLSLAFGLGSFVLFRKQR